MFDYQEEYVDGLMVKMEEEKKMRIAYKGRRMGWLEREQREMVEFLQTLVISPRHQAHSKIASDMQ